MKVWVGTSGYSYADWVGGFYPPGTRPNRMLAAYARHFPLVELNFTYYRVPTAAMLARLADLASPPFQFLVKLHRSLSHEKNPAELPAFRAAVDELHGRGQLLGLLCQLPQSFHDKPEHRAWVDRLAEEFAGRRLAVEFRHRSWAAADVAPWLAARGVDLVAVDVPDLPGLYPRGLVQTGPRVYVRFHSRNPANWYASDTSRYDFDYPDEALAEWVEELRQAETRTVEALLLFNNCHAAQAAVNARRMQELLNRLLPRAEVVEPPAEPGTRQRTLFD